jgi:hypothetical protein
MVWVKGGTAKKCKIHLGGPSLRITRNANTKAAKKMIEKLARFKDNDSLR